MEINETIDYVIGMDIGTGSTKAIALDTTGKVIAQTQHYYETQIPNPGYAEQDPEIIWMAFVNCIREIIEKLDRVPLAVSISSCMHSLLLISKGNKPLTPLITWADTRSEKIAVAMRKSPECENFYRYTGTPVHSMSPLCKIQWFKENEPGIFEETAYFISIKEFIWHRLFGVYETDTSVASATGLFNIENFNWHLPSLEICRISEKQLSKIVPTTFTRKGLITTIPDTLSLSPDTNFCIGGSDGCLANIGSFAITPHTAALTIGTSGAVRIACNKPLVNYDAMIFNYVLDEKTFICGGPINNGGIVVKWLFKTFLNIEDPNDEDYEAFFKEISSVPAGSEGLLFLPYLYGERAPVWDGDSSGMFFGIQAHHTQAHFLKAGIEGICYALKNVLQILEGSTETIKNLSVSGGFVNSKIWMQILADISGKNLYVIQTEDASSIGAAMLCMKSMGLISDYEAINPGTSVTIRPNEKNDAIYKKYYSVYKNLYSPTKEMMHEIQRINSGNPS